MPVPNFPIPTPPRPPHPLAVLPRLAVLSAIVLGFLLPSAAFARGPEAPRRLPLESFGVQPLSTQFLLNGSSMLTLHYVDDQHLLLTFVVHRLIPRVPNDPVDDQDRMVDAVLLEASTGKVLARTTWHLHDHAQYLWSLGHGHFLLRIRDTLTTFAPLANLATPQPFAQRPFITSADRRFAALIVSPDADLLIAESIKPMPVDKMPKTPLFGPAQSPTPQLTERNPVQINFYRLHAPDDGGPVQVSAAGVIQSRNTGDFPVTTAGYLAVVDQGHQHWAFDFHSYSGKTDELSPFDSSCSPAALFVSHSEFIAFGCRGGQTRQQIGGFNMRGEEMWEQGLFGDFVSPSLVYAPAGGRFALSRIMLRSTAMPDQPLSEDEVSSQTVVVYQTGTGKQLLHADCSPVERAGQNFALSPNGLSLAVVHADAIEIYNLPPLTTKDESDLKLARTIAPPENNLPVHFTGRASTSTNADADRANEPVPPPVVANAPPTATAANPASAAAPAATAPAATSTPASANNPPPVPAPTPPSTQPAAQSPTSQPVADPAPVHRAPPTIYTLPTDKKPASPNNSQSQQ